MLGFLACTGFVLTMNTMQQGGHLMLGQNFCRPNILKSTPFETSSLGDRSPT